MSISLKDRITKISQKDLLLEYIKQKLDINILNEDKYEEKANKIFCEKNTNLIVETSENFEIETDNTHLFIIYDPNQKYEVQKIQEQITSKKEVEIKEDAEIYILEVFDSLEVYSEKGDNLSREKAIKDTINNNQKKNIRYYACIIPNYKKHFKNEIINIRIDDRVRSIEKNLNEIERELQCYVFSANLTDLIKLYNLFGDELFSKNVRNGGIDDNTDVDTSIRETFLNHPNQFWCLHNGISLMLNAKQIDLDTYDRIKINIKDLYDISVINGAQTLFTVSKAYYKMKEKFTNGDPYVLLRIFFYNKQNHEIDRFNEKVTLCLNRQKPIKQDDLSYMTNFVKNIEYIKNQKKDLEEYTFSFVRRGEISSKTLHVYELGEFAKVTKAYLSGKPAKARSSSYRNLLDFDRKDNNEIPKLKDKVFVEELQDEPTIISEKLDDYAEIFVKNYKPVNFAMKLKAYLEQKEKVSKKSNWERIIDETMNNKTNKKINKNNSGESLSKFSKYGILIVVSLVINYLNDEKEIDGEKNFSSWKYADIGIGTAKEQNKTIYGEEELKKLLGEIVCTFNDLTKKDKDELKDTESWKNDKIIKKLYKKMMEKKI